MAISGEEDPAELFSRRLNPQTLMRLARDILFVRHHTAIRITNGPGDGKRDLHSIDQNHKQFVTQCKHSSKKHATCSTDDLDELPTALMKMGCNHGLFVTNCRISPQAKREYLENYPGFQLEFVDGETLALTVMENPLLRSVWFDGKTIGEINQAFVIPFIVRQHDDDRPFRLSKEHHLKLCEYMSVEFPDSQISVKALTRSADIFFPYRAPVEADFGEGISYFLSHNGIVAQGNVSISDFNRLRKVAAKAIAGVLTDQESGFTVVIGDIEIEAVGILTGAKPLEPGVRRLALVCTPFVCTYEDEFFFVCDNNSGWTADSTARVTESQDIRYYSHTLDCCLGYEIRYEVSLTTDKVEAVIRLERRREWIKSIHAFVPQWTTWEYSIPEPSDFILWPWNGQNICCWYANDFTNPQLSEIRDVLAQSDTFEILSPHKARHMIASEGVDILGEILEQYFPTCEVAAMSEIIPSPVDPKSRQFEFTMVWKDPIEVQEIIEAAMSSAEELGIAVTDILCERDGEFIVLVCSPDNVVVDVPTKYVFEDFSVMLSAWFGSIEKRFGSLQRATKEYWRVTYGFTLGEPWGGYESEEQGLSDSLSFL